MFVKRWIKITEVMWNKFQENVCHNCNHADYIWHTLQKNICILVFSHTLVGTVLWFFHSSFINGISPAGPQMCQNHCKSILSREKLIFWAVLSAGFIFFKSSEINLFVCCDLLRVVQRHKSRSRSEESNGATRPCRPEWSLENWTWSVVFRSLQSWKYMLELRKNPIFLFPRQ